MEPEGGVWGHVKIYVLCPTQYFIYTLLKHTEIHNATYLAGKANVPQDRMETQKLTKIGTTSLFNMEKI